MTYLAGSRLTQVTTRSHSIRYHIRPTRDQRRQPTQAVLSVHCHCHGRGTSFPPESLSQTSRRKRDHSRGCAALSSCHSFQTPLVTPPVPTILRIILISLIVQYSHVPLSAVYIRAIRPSLPSLHRQQSDPPIPIRTPQLQLHRKAILWTRARASLILLPPTNLTTGTTCSTGVLSPQPLLLQPLHASTK